MLCYSLSLSLAFPFFLNSNSAFAYLLLPNGTLFTAACEALTIFKLVFTTAFSLFLSLSLSCFNLAKLSALFAVLRWSLFLFLFLLSLFACLQRKEHIFFPKVNASFYISPLFFSYSYGVWLVSSSRHQTPICLKFPFFSLFLLLLYLFPPNSYSQTRPP